ncbi:hypothetical protein F3N42_05750 [Marinihelvus fidelis]|uniref:Secreted protein n=1 Tax=Marinihelvus fidelis TaxID=2613842 RepID=A0A5N0TFR7_9GAMM|nr:hypothetical protein [Marinihelvus fidelis]KAA9132716.1 hypothetical protein F3N42_05750 [Marinihelvus fidelis]
MRLSRHLFVATATAAMAAVPAVPAMAGTTPEMDGLLGMSTQDGEAELGRRGFNFVHNRPFIDGTLSNWWNSATQVCLALVARNDIFDAIRKAPPQACESMAGQGNARDFHELVGESASSADLALDREGFRAVDRHEGISLTSTWWYAPRTAECVKVDVAEDRVERVSKTPRYPACRVQ